MRSCFLVWMIIAFFPCSPAVQAQEFQRAEEIAASGTAYHTFVRPGELTVQVIVLGTASDGIYEVGNETMLDQLLALAGGAPTSAGGRATRQKTTVRLFRSAASSRILLYEAPLERMLVEPGQYPALQDGDILTLETIEKQRFGIREGATILSALAALTLVLERVLGGS